MLTAKGFLEERRIETPYAIIDFVFSKPIYTSGYKFVFDLQKDLDAEEQNERLLRLAIGEDEKWVSVLWIRTT